MVVSVLRMRGVERLTSGGEMRKLNDQGGRG